MDLADMLAPRIWSMYTLPERGHIDSVEPWARLWSEGHGDVWRTDAEHVEKHHELFLAALLDDA